MKKTPLHIIIIIACVLIALPARAFSPAETPAPAAMSAAASGATLNENLTYNIYFHMGFIWAKAGQGNLSYKKETESNGQVQYHGQLAAKSLSIVEHIMKVRDTLDCWFNADLVPIRFRKGTHEGSYNSVALNTYVPYWHNKDAAKAPSNVDSTAVTINRWRKKGDDPRHDDIEKFSNKGVAYDMLSVFYSIRHLDYAKMEKGKKMQFVCYDGLKCQMINVEFIGKEKCKLRSEKQYDSYLVHLTFDTKGQKNTPLKVWLSTTSDHRPVKAVIGLNRIGSVQCEINE